MPELPESAVTAAVDEVMKRRHLTANHSRAWAEPIVRDALEAAAPVLAEAVARKITGHMEKFGPRKPRGALEPVSDTGRAHRAWRRHFGIAARVAAGAFSTDDDKLRMAAEAIGRGDYAACYLDDAGNPVAGERED